MNDIIKNISLIVAELTDVEFAEVSDLINAQNFIVTVPPRSGLLMMKTTDCFDVNFCLGEILITEAEVTLNQTVGYGSLTGEEPEKALFLAKFDAMRQVDSLLLNSLVERLNPAWERIVGKRKVEEQFALSTKVEFNTMD